MSTEACGAPWRPRGRSGVVKQTTISWGEATTCDSTSTANRAVPAQAILKVGPTPTGPRPRRRRDLALAELAQGAGALLARGAFEDEDAVEVIDLVLDDARLEALDVVLEAPAAQVAGAHADSHGRSTGSVMPGRLRQPSSAISVSRDADTILGLTSVTGSSSTS